MVCENDFAMQWQFVLKGNEGRAYAPPLTLDRLLLLLLSSFWWWWWCSEFFLLNLEN